MILRAVLLLAFLPPQVAQDGGSQELLRRLDAAEGGELEATLAELAGDRPAATRAARAALEGFAERPALARRARARLLAEVGAPEIIDGVLSLLADPDPVVRANLAAALGARSLAATRSEERQAALLELAAADPALAVRAAARDALAQAALPGTPAALDQLLDRLPPQEARDVAQALPASPGGRARLVQRVRAAFAGELELDREVLVALLSGYGRALAEVPRGGRDAGERLPFVRGFFDPSQEVRVAAYAALTRCVGRLIELGQLERADVLLVRLSEEGLPRHDLLYRRVSLALSWRGDAQAALALARALEDAAALAPEEERETYRFYAIHDQGAARFALGELAAARADFERARELVAHLLEERLDLARGPRTFARAFQELGGRIMVDRLELVALEELWIVLTRLAEGAQPSDRGVLEGARAAHESLLLARALGTAADVPRSSSFSDVLGRDLAPGPLVVDARRVARWSDGRGHDLLAELGRALATVAPWEVPGFEPAEGLGPAERRLTDPLFDPERFALYARIRDEYGNLIQRELIELHMNPDGVDQARYDSLLSELGRLRAEISKEATELARVRDPRAEPPEALLALYRSLADHGTQPALLAQVLASNLRDDGRTEEARVLAQRLLADLRAGMPGAQSVWIEWASAQAEMTIGSAYTDEGRAAEAEAVYLSAVRRLEEIENAQVARGADAETSAGVQQVRLMRANVLLSLAVNANVRMGDTERALAYFERAFELDQRDFMQALLACYRARSGREEEARAVLRALQPAPALYYNIACTHALLGDTREALDFLLREFEENHPTARSRARQQQWAREDPDLASLRDDPAFRRLVGLD